MYRELAMPHLIAATLSGAAMAVLLPAGTALAFTETPPTTALRLTMGQPSLAEGSNVRSVVLHCDPAGGGHPRAVQACDQLARNGGRFTKPAGNMACTLQYAPVQVTAGGRWRGRAVQFTKSYGNSCELRAHTGALFDF
jgi:subtilisin inhibitor-like